MVCQGLHRSETHWALNPAPRAGEWKSHDQLSSQGSLRGSPGWEFRRLRWDVSLQTALLSWRILDHPRGQSEKCRMAAALEVRNPFSYQGEALWGPSVQNLSAIFLPWHFKWDSWKHNSPGLILWLLVFPCHKLQFPQHFGEGLCCALPLYSPSNPRNLKLKCLTCWDRSYYCFKRIRVKDDILNNEKRNLIITARLFVGGFLSVFKDPWKAGKETQSYFTFFRSTKGKKVLCGLGD